MQRKRRTWLRTDRDVHDYAQIETYMHAHMCAHINTNAMCLIRDNDVRVSIRVYEILWCNLLSDDIGVCRALAPAVSASGTSFRHPASWSTLTFFICTSYAFWISMAVWLIYLRNFHPLVPPATHICVTFIRLCHLQLIFACMAIMITFANSNDNKHDNAKYIWA